VQYPGPRGKRPTLKLGKAGKAAHEEMRGHVNALLNAKATNTAAPLHTARWLAGIGDELHGELARHRLVEPRQVREAAQLKSFIDGYIKKRTDLKPRSLSNLEQSRNSLVRFFGARRDLATITDGEAADWHRHEKQDYAKATVSMFVKKARQFLADAASRGIVAANPFAKLRAGSQSNEARMEYVSRETIQKVIDACPDSEWRLLFGLARYAGLRIPSEIRGLGWCDYDPARQTLRILSSKTEHHDGGAERVVPVVPDLDTLIGDAWAVSSDYDAHCPAHSSSSFMLPRLRGRTLVTQAEKIIEKAGVPRWGKLFQNLRSSCQTDLEERFPSHVVCSWLGNSPAVARKHYLQVTDAHFEAATKLSAAVSAGGSGQDRTKSEPVSKNPRSPEGLRGSKYPQGDESEYQKRGESSNLAKLVSSGVSKATIRRAMRRAQAVAHPDVYQANVRALRNSPKGGE
jgi:integrase